MAKLFFPEDVEGTLVQITALPAEATVDNVLYFQKDGSFYRRIKTGKFRAKDVAILNDGTSQTARIAVVLAHASVKELIFDEGDVTITGTLNGVEGKKLVFQNGARWHRCNPQRG